MSMISIFWIITQNITVWNLKTSLYVIKFNFRWLILQYNQWANKNNSWLPDQNGSPESGYVWKYRKNYDKMYVGNRQYGNTYITLTILKIDEEHM